MKPGIKKVFRRGNLPGITLILILISFLYTLWYFHPWKQNENGTRGVIKWDVISYYAYLPATVIHGDPTLEFLDEGNVRNDNKFWYEKLENGNRLIVTSMGLSFLYAPFFLVAHALAPLLGQANDGFSNIYQLMLVVSGFFYAFMGLILLSRFLRKHFDPVIVAITLLVTGLGTNLFFYSTIEAAMPHSYNFFLITAWMILVVRWYKDPRWYNALFTGLLFGLIALVRPTNILLFLFLLLYGVTGWKTFLERVRFYIRKWYLVSVMLAAFLLPWIPQFIYWKVITGHYLFFTYSVKGATFYFAHPHILYSLFHIRKGWLIYTPLMAFALAGIPLLRRNHKGWFLALAIYVPAMIYVQSSWWCWWFGGGFGLRAYISMYPLLAFPLAVLLTELNKTRFKAFYGVTSLILLLVVYQMFQTRQHTTGAVHYSGTTLRSYGENFLKVYPTGKSWQMLELPDFNLARLGIHISYPTSEEKEQWAALDTVTAHRMITEEILESRKLEREIRRYAAREGITLDSAMTEVVERMYYRKTN